LYSSTVDLKYRGMLYDATPFDSSYLSTSPADSIVRLQVGNSGLIEGWSLGLMQMHVGDSCRIVIPYNLGYGSYEQGSVIKPFSMLVFDIKLQDIYAYEVRP
ncbi:MAG: FKBP-type peptidyl-prolyl cis-trans isomerase, partial [Muribaculaceae bacterium]|nr:FKBP-type peptidyl-prolyl cis-trans isomerase [Muribaculaceae bacterium]